MTGDNPIDLMDLFCWFHAKRGRLACANLSPRTPVFLLIFVPTHTPFLGAHVLRGFRWRTLNTRHRTTLERDGQQFRSGQRSCWWNLMGLDYIQEIQQSKIPLTLTQVLVRREQIVGIEKGGDIAGLWPAT